MEEGGKQTHTRLLQAKVVKMTILLTLGFSCNEVTEFSGISKETVLRYVRWIQTHAESDAFAEELMDQINHTVAIPGIRWRIRDLCKDLAFDKMLGDLRFFKKRAFSEHLRAEVAEGAFEKIIQRVCGKGVHVGRGRRFKPTKRSPQNIRQ
jgi:hypothetical protein